MKKTLLTLFGLLGGFLATEAQTARVMAIHNSADPALDTVDVWLTTPQGSLKLVDNFGFRQSTGFVNAPAGVPIRISFAAKNSTLITDTLIGFGFNLASAERYILFAEGHLQSGFNPQKSFNLNVLAGALENYNTAGDTTAVAVYHGSTDAPAVDVYAKGVGSPIVANAAYGAITAYLKLPTNDYTLLVHGAGSSTTLLAYNAPLETLGLEDEAVVVFASGFLNPAANRNGKPFGLFAALANGDVRALPMPTSRVMAIHNSADPAVDTVDVWLTTPLNVNKIAENFGFRQSTGYVDVPAEIPVTIGFAAKNSNNITDTVAAFGFVLAGAEKYVLLAQGHVGTGFNPQVPFGLSVLSPAIERGTGGDVRVALHHGSTDAPNVDVFARAGGNAEPGSLLSNVPYGASVGYLSVPEADVLIDVHSAGIEEPLLTYAAPLRTLNAGDSALVVFASGFVNPANNNNGKPFGLFAALSNGMVLPLPAVTKARVMVIHNSADPAADTVDVWLLNNTTNVSEKIVDNFGFRTSTGYVDLPGNTDISLGIAPKNSDSYDDIIYEEEVGVLPAGIIAVAMATGVIDTTKFEANPNGIDINFFINGAFGKENGTPANTVDILVSHGVTDAPTVSIRPRGATTGFELLSFSDFSNYDGEYTNLPATDIILDVIPAGSSSALVSYDAPLSALSGLPVVAFASGFLSPNAPTNKDVNGAAFGLFVAKPNGEVIPLSLNTSVAPVKPAFVNGISVYPNPANGFVMLSFESKEANTAQVSLVDITGREVFTRNINVLGGNNLTNVDISGIQKGIYFLQVKTTKGLSTQKLLVE
jgi:hypothetical protein